MEEVFVRMNDHVQPLEPRRLLSFTPVGGETAATLPTPVEEFDLAVAGDATHVVAGAHLSGGGTATISAVRYSAAGEQLGEVLTIDSFPSVELLGIEVVSVSADADGDAVVAYFVQG